MVMTGIENNDLALRFMKAVAPNMSVGNTDGIGYSAVNSKNQLFMEKWHVNNKFLNTNDVVDAKTIEELKPYENRIGKLQLNYTSYGDVTRDDLRSVTMHTRYATCGKTFENTHPFIENDISLIHNGVIQNSFTLALNKNSTCDSENALQLYNNLQVNLSKKSTDYQSFLDKLKGYWAFAFLAKDSEGTYQLDVVREGAPLYFAKIEEIGVNCVVFATTKEIIEIGCKELELPVRSQIYLLTESNYHRFNALTGELILNKQLEDSLLNASSYSYSKVFKSNKTKKKEPYQPLNNNNIDEYYDYYNSQENYKDLTSVTDEFLLDSFYDINEPLVDRLDSYDKMFDTEYLSNFEDLAIKIRDFITKQEYKEVISFAEIILMLDAYIASENISDLYKVFRNKRRA
jgi:hypothetical protein